MTNLRRLAAILAADMVGQSRLMGEDEEGAQQRFPGSALRARSADGDPRRIVAVSRRFSPSKRAVMRPSPSFCARAALALCVAVSIGSEVCQGQSQSDFARASHVQPTEPWPQQGGGSERDFVTGFRPIPKVLAAPAQGLPERVPTIRPPHNPNYRRTAVEVPAAKPGPTARRHHARGNVSIAPALAGCAAYSANNSRPHVSTTHISFAFASAILTPEAKQVLRNLGHALNGGLRDVKSFEIDGHTDGVGSFAYNEQLSKLRAEAARDFLVHEMGVSPKRLTAVGRSYCGLADPEHPDAGINRRVVVVNLAE